MSIGSDALEPPFEVVVPASTSNLGPGFDFLGLALSLRARVRVIGAAPRGAHRFAHRFDRLHGRADGWPRDERNHVLRAFDRAVRALGGDERPMVFEADSEIPVGRGLGSSGAAVAAGLLLGASLAPRPVDVDRLIEWGLELEGHPDNSTAALLGGCTLAVPHGGGRLRVVRQPLHASLAFAVAWPARELATARARAVLPASVPFADAVENPRRLALLLEGLRTGDPELLALGGEDKLHVERRLPLIPGSREALGAAREAGAWLATLSGAGSGLFAIAPHARVAAVARALADELERGEPGAEGRVVEPVHGTPVVVRA